MSLLNRERQLVDNRHPRGVYRATDLVAYCETPNRVPSQRCKQTDHRPDAARVDQWPQRVVHTTSNSNTVSVECISDGAGSDSATASAENACARSPERLVLNGRTGYLGVHRRRRLVSEVLFLFPPQPPALASNANVLQHI